MDRMERDGTEAAAATNSQSNFELYIREQLQNVILDWMDRDPDLGRSILNTPDIYELLAKEYARDLYPKLRENARALAEQRTSSE